MIVAGTGHRPNKLGGYGVEAATHVVRVAQHYFLDTEQPELVITGGALGWDQAVATACWLLGIPYAMYLPFENFERKWPQASQDTLKYLCSKAVDVRHIAEPGYAPWKMQVRNEAMVKDCDLVLALWDGSRGGTGNCVAYANKVGKPITNLWDAYNNNKE